MGIYNLVGHWQECQLSDVDYKDCPKDKLKDSIERSYLVIRPDSLSTDDFKGFIQELVNKFNQDAALVSFDGKVYGLESSGNMFDIGDKIKLNKIAQAYSQFVKKMNVPFVFEGIEIPSSNSSKMVFKECGTLYDVDATDLKEWDNI
jgi:hypothetical protein